MITEIHLVHPSADPFSANMTAVLAIRGEMEAGPYGVTGKGVLIPWSNIKRAVLAHTARQLRQDEPTVEAKLPQKPPEVKTAAPVLPVVRRGPGRPPSKP